MTGRSALSLSFRIIGVVFAVTGLGVALSSAIFVSRAFRVVGTVVDYRVVQNAISLLPAGEPTGMLYYPIVEYSMLPGESRTVIGRTGRAVRAYDTGERVGVLVSFRDAANARINTVFDLWGGSIILGALAALFLLLSVLAPLGFGGS